jgi:hypothetical protein
MLNTDHPRPSWRHLLIRTDPTGEFAPSNARWQVANWYRRATTDGADTFDAAYSEHVRQLFSAHPRYRFGHDDASTVGPV